MGLQRKVKTGDVLYLQRGEEVIAICCDEFFQGDFGGNKVRLIVDAPKSWSINHIEKGKSHANNQRTNQEEVHQVDPTTEIERQRQLEKLKDYHQTNPYKYAPGDFGTNK